MKIDEENKWMLGDAIDQSLENQPPAVLEQVVQPEILVEAPAPVDQNEIDFAQPHGHDLQPMEVDQPEDAADILDGLFENQIVFESSQQYDGASEGYQSATSIVQIPLSKTPIRNTASMIDNALEESETTWFVNRQMSQIAKLHIPKKNTAKNPMPKSTLLKKKPVVQAQVEQEVK